MPKIHSVFPKNIFLSAAYRSPIGKFGGALKTLSAPQLAAKTLKSAVNKSGLVEVDYVLMGHGRQAGAGPNPARQTVIFSGLGEKIPAMTINQACASGLISVISAAEKIAVNKAENIWAGGVESMSNTPYLLTGARWGYRMGHNEVLDGMRQDGFFCPMSQMLMGETVENILVPEFKISAQEQNEFALESQKRAAAAWSKNLFKDEILEIDPEGKFAGLKIDEHVRGDITLEALAKLAPAFNPKGGTLTAGNSSGVTDGAAFVHVGASKNSSTLAELLDYEVIALDPKRMGLGPVESIQNLLKRQGLEYSDIEVFEINEAFAAQAIACQRTLKIPSEKLNPRGGAIALGHPIGATGTRILTTLLHQLKGKPGALGVASLCVSGGMGVTVLVRSV